MPDINGGGENGTVADIAIITVVVIVFNDMMIAAYGQDTSQLLII